MCTVTFIARKSGFALGMNRDEKLTRPAAHPPAIARIGTRRALFPSEPGGGTWIGVNDAGICFALINWYSVSSRVAGLAVSRGDIVRSMLAADTIAASQKLLSAQPLNHVNPFRMIGFFSVEKAICEWRWDLKTLHRLHHPWETQTWISSGFDETGAQKTRDQTFAEALRQKTAGTLPWLRRLHRSHKPERGPYSTCMHRADAATVSYTEVVASPLAVSLRYQPAAPCKPRGSHNNLTGIVKIKSPSLTDNPISQNLNLSRKPRSG